MMDGDVYVWLSAKVSRECSRRLHQLASASDVSPGEIITRMVVGEILTRDEFQRREGLSDVEMRYLAGYGHE